MAQENLEASGDRLEQASPQTDARIARRRWRIAWLLGVGVLVNYFDRVNLSVSHDSLIAAFGINDVVFGYLSSAYNWTYALCQLPIGVVLDKFGVRRVGRIGTFLWSVASFAAAVTPSLSGFFGARLLLGVGEAPTFPANAKAIGAWFPPHSRNLATSLFDAAAKFAPAVGVPLIGFALLAAGWRWSFALTGVISFIYFVAFWRVYREPGEDPKLTESERRYIECVPLHPRPAEPAPSSLGTLLRQRKVIGLTIGFGAYNYVFYMLLYWLPTYLSSALHIDLMHSFAYTGLPWIFATMTDIAVGGWLVDFLIRRGWNASRVRQVVLVGGTTFGLGILGAAHAHNATQALVWISISIGGLSAAAPVGWTVAMLISARADLGKVGGILNFYCQLSGITASILTGYIVSALHSYMLAFTIAAVYLAVGIASYLILLGRVENPDDGQQASAT